MDHSTRGLGTLSSPQRNHYFYGKLMDVPHFEMEQWYGNKKRWLLNRLGLGYGILCGLGLTIKENKVCIAPGVAIDRYGREIIVPHEVCLDPWAVTDECGRQGSTPLSKTEEHQVYLCLAYKECQTDFMPVLVTDCNVKEDCLPGTTVESYALLIKEGKVPKPKRMEALCKILNSEATESVKRTKLCQLLAKETCSTKEESDICVVLGSVTLKSDGTIGKIDPCSDRTTLVSNERLLDMVLCLTSPRGGNGTLPIQEDLTHISRFSRVDRDDNDDNNVPKETDLHDKDVQVAEFPSQLAVTFSRDVQTRTSAQNYKAWFIVTLELPFALGIGGIMTHVASSPPTGYTLLNLDGEIRLTGNRATFTIGSKKVLKVRELKNSSSEAMRLLCRVMVKCDFLYGAQDGKAVDGNHLRGVLPSGDGIPGGDFESWFTVIVPPTPPGN